MRTVRVHVPDTSNERDIRIITNSALEEIRGNYDGVLHQYKVDLARGLVIYHEGANLMNGAFRGRVSERLSEIGYPATFRSVGPNPLPLGHTADGKPFDSWPGRATAIISVPDMKTKQDANRIVAAISLARTGDAPRSIQLNRDSRIVTISFNGAFSGAKNIQHAIASAGFAADEIDARYGRADAEVHNWRPWLPDDV
jgi:hypothetical protein